MALVNLTIPACAGCCCPPADATLTLVVSGWYGCEWYTGGTQWNGEFTLVPKTDENGAKYWRSDNLVDAPPLDIGNGFYATGYLAFCIGGAFWVRDVNVEDGYYMYGDNFDGSGTLAQPIANTYADCEGATGYGAGGTATLTLNEP